MVVVLHWETPGDRSIYLFIGNVLLECCPQHLRGNSKNKKRKDTEEEDKQKRVNMERSKVGTIEKSLEVPTTALA